MAGFNSKQCRLLSMLSLTIFFFFVEIIVGYITNSMALVADSFHMLSDLVALIIAYISVKMSPKRWSKNTFGWARAEVIGALLNAVFLIALCFTITVEACIRFVDVEEITNPQLLLVVGGLGLLVNVIGLFLFHDHGHSHGHTHNKNPKTENPVIRDANENIETVEPAPKKKSHGHSHSSSGEMNMRGVFLHVLSDALGSVIVVISAIVIWFTDWQYKYYLDPILSILLVLLIIHSTWPLFSESALILLQTVPTHLQLDEIKERLLASVDGVLAVHQFHVWQLAGDRIIATAHMRFKNLPEYMKTAVKVKNFFHNEGIHSTTIQPEFMELSYDDDEQLEDCILECPKTNSHASCIMTNKDSSKIPDNIK